VNAMMQPRPASRARGTAARERRLNDRVDTVSSIAGLLAVGAGVVSLMAVSVAAILTLPDGNGRNVVATSTGSFGVIGTVVDAYFGVKLGADGRQDAQQAQRTEAAEGQALAAPLNTDEANQGPEGSRTARSRAPVSNHNPLDRLLLTASSEIVAAT
jgi:hypothetical protein